MLDVWYYITIVKIKIRWQFFLLQMFLAKSQCLTYSNNININSYETLAIKQKMLAIYITFVEV